MANIVKEFPTIKRGRPEVYPYKEWFNGKPWALKQGVDFHVKPESFKAAIYARKNKLDLTIKTATVVDENGIATVYVQRLMGAAAKARQAKNVRGRKAPAKKVAA